MKYPEDYINKIICGDCLWIFICGLIITWFVYWLFTHRENERKENEAISEWITGEPHHGADWYK